MSRYIDADKIQYKNGMVTRIAIEEIPTAEVKPIVYGNWVSIDDEPHDVWECDHCGFVLENDRTNYCPNCGRKMKGSE